MAKKRCYQCGREIDLDNDKYVLLGTYNGTGKARKDESFFHFQCWIGHFNEAIMRRIQKSQDVAMKMLKQTLANTNIEIQNE